MGRPTPNTTGSRDFQKETGCTVKPQTFGTSDEAYTLFSTNPGQFDVVSASGDASLRLVRGGFVQPVNLDLFKNYPDIFPALKNKPYNTVDGVPYGVPHGRGSNLLMWRTDQVTPAPTTWAQMFDPANGYKVSIYDAPIYIADAAVVLMKTKPELGITNPYALDDTQFTAAIDLLKQQKPAVTQRWVDYLKQMDDFRSGTRTSGRPGRSSPTCSKAGEAARHGRSHQADRRRDRLVRHLDDQLEVEEPRLLVRVHRLPGLAQDQRGDRRLLRRGARQLQVVHADPGRFTPTVSGSTTMADHCTVFHAERRRLLEGRLVLADARRPPAWTAERT